MQKQIIERFQQLGATLATDESASQKSVLQSVSFSHVLYMQEWDFLQKYLSQNYAAK